MSFGEDPGHGENLRVKGQQQALQEMLQSSVNAYARMLNSAALFPFFLYQQSLAMTAQVARGSLSSATGVARQYTQEEVVGGDRPARGAEGTVQSDRQGAEVAGEPRVSGAEPTDQTLPEMDEAAPGPSDPVSSPSSKAPEVPNTVDELPLSPAPPDEPTARAVHEADRGSVEPSSRAEGETDEGTAGPMSTVPSTEREEFVMAEEPSPTDGVTGLSPPPKVPDVELPPPPLVPQNILDELPPSPDEQPTARTTRGEKPRIHVRKGTAAARRTAKELNVDLDEVEGTGRNGQITVGDVRKKAAEKKP